jgi:hypothetical protein
MVNGFLIKELQAYTLAFVMVTPPVCQICPAKRSAVRERTLRVASEEFFATLPPLHRIGPFHVWHLPASSCNIILLVYGSANG